jgi:hypothetical protein
MDMLKAFYATKHTVWKHEAEFRLISREKDRAYDLPCEISQVILGEKAKDAEARQVLEAVKRLAPSKKLRMMREPGTWNYRAYGSST